MDDVWAKRFETIRILGWLALASPFCAVAAIATSDTLRIVLTAAAFGLFLPAFVYVYVVILWHWKARYRGQHSDFWGAVLLIETSGWSKVIYLLRHLLPDMRKTGRYRAQL